MKLAKNKKKKKGSRRGAKARRAKPKRKFGLLQHGLGIGAERAMNVIGLGKYYKPMHYIEQGAWADAAQAWVANESMSWTGFNTQTGEWLPERMVPNYIMLFGTHYLAKFLNSRKPLPFKKIKW